MNPHFSCSVHRPGIQPGHAAITWRSSCLTPIAWLLLLVVPQGVSGLLWDDAEALGGGMYRSAWFGDFHRPDTSAIIHQHGHGWLAAYGASAVDVWIHDVSLDDWLWTSAAVYPYLYSVHDRSWYYYHTDNAGWLYSYRYADHFRKTQRIRTLVAATIAPSSQPTVLTDATTGVSLTIPGGLLAESAIAEIRAVPAERVAGSASSALAGGDTYEISLGDADTFAEPLTISIPYDPALLNPDLDPARAVCLATYNAGDALWVVTPATVDTVNHTLILETPHLSKWRAYYIARGYSVHTAGVFQFVYDPAAMPIVGASQYYARDFIDLAAQDLVASWDAYAALDFRMPPAPVWVFLEKGAEEAEYNAKTGNTFLSEKYESRDELRHECAHELFHAVQNCYFSFPGMLARRWFMEATADFAATVIAWNRPERLRAVLTPDYLSFSLGTRNDRHEYQTAALLNSLLGGSGAAFKALWDEVAAHNVPVVLVPLEKYCIDQRSMIFSDHYTEFARDFIFNPAGNLAALDLQATPPNEAPGVLPAEGGLTRTLNLAGPYSARLWGVVNNNNNEVGVTVSVPNMPANTAVSIHVLPGNVRAAGDYTSIYASDGAKTVNVPAGAGVYALAVNRSNQTGDKGVTIHMASSSVQTKPFTTTIDNNYLTNSMRLVLTASGSLATPGVVLSAIATGSQHQVDVSIVSFATVTGNVVISGTYQPNITLHTINGPQSGGSGSTWTYESSNRFITTISNFRTLLEGFYPASTTTSQNAGAFSLTLPANQETGYNIYFAFDYTQTVQAIDPSTGEWANVDTSTGTARASIAHVYMSVW